MGIYIYIVRLTDIPGKINTLYYLVRFTAEFVT